KTLKVSPPSEFSGDRRQGRSFLNSCLLYIRLCRDQFANDLDKILWVLLFFRLDRAARWADNIFDEERTTGAFPFLEWSEFETEFHERFCPIDARVDATNTLESTSYFQRERSVDDYVDEFCHLVSEAGYQDPRMVVVKFRRGLEAGIQNQIATSYDR